MKTPTETTGSQLLKQIFALQRFTVPAVSEATRISMTTVSKYVEELQRIGFVRSSGYVDTGKKGRRPVQYELCTSNHCFFGVDVKSFELNLGVMDLMGEMVAFKHLPDFRFDNTYNKIDEICQSVTDFMAEYQRDGRKVLAANFNISGRVNSQAGTSHSIFNFEDTQEMSLTQLLKARLGIPTYIENDSKVMAYGEYWSMPVQKQKNVLFVNVSEGIGMGIIINGEIYYGNDGYAGELGHIYRYDNNIPCHCGKKGCFETEVSGRAIRRKLKERIYGHAQSLLAKRVWEQRDITMADIVRAAEMGDGLCVELLAETGRELGKELAALVNIMNPGCIIIGGAIAQAPESCFLEPLRDMVRQYTLGLMRHQLSITASALGKKAGTIGACMIARHKTLAQMLF